ncbi:MAG: DeoR/GlpR transcriptional regulator [Gammaproteobacteria bacterium]|nr:DeoR/GlpR transcriptional regulator [Gammaproteobacteria bacterium]
MKPKQRRSRILEVVSEKGQISVEDLACRFEVSAETIRRDLGLMADTGALQKVHGGAKRLSLHTEGSFDDRMAESVEAKELIAQKLARLIEPGATVFLDTGSTTVIGARALSHIRGLTVITNSLQIAQLAGWSQSDSVVYLLGGRYGDENGETVGPLTIKQIAGFQADYAIITVAALDSEAGAMDSNFDEAQVAQAMIGCSNRLIVLANAAKLNRKAAYRVCQLSEIDSLVCDRVPESYFISALNEAGVELH